METKTLTDTLMRTETIFEKRGRPTVHPVLGQLSQVARSELIRHLNGPQPIKVVAPGHSTVLLLRKRGFIMFDGSSAVQQRRSWLTDKGKDAAGICAEYEASRIIENENRW